MSERARRVLGVLTVLPAINFALFFVVFFWALAYTMGHSDAELAANNPVDMLVPILFGGVAVMVLWNVGLAFFYWNHIFHNDRIPEECKWPWIFVGLIHPFGQIVYWRRYIRSAQPPHSGDTRDRPRLTA